MFEHLPWKVENSLDRFFRNRESSLELVGTDSPTLLAGLLTLPKVAMNDKPHLIVVGNARAAENLVTSIQFLSPEARPIVLPSFDVGVYSNLYPNRRTIAGRLGWLWRAQNARPGRYFYRAD